MKRYLFISALVAFAALAFSCTKEELGPDALSSGDTGRESGSVTGEVPVDHSVAPGTVIVRFSEETMQAIEPDLLEGKVVTRSMELNQAVDEYDIVSMERVFGDGGIYEERARREGLHQWYRIKYRGDAPVAGAVLAFASMKGVVSAEPERRIRVDAFNDKYFSQQTDLVSGGSKFDINVQPVWDHYTTGDPSVIVSVVDEGVDLDHADLASNCIPGGKGGSRNFADIEKSSYLSSFLVLVDAGIQNKVSNFKSLSPKVSIRRCLICGITVPRTLSCFRKSIAPPFLKSFNVNWSN